MPYISKEEVKEKRNSLRKSLPDYKLSVRMVHYSTIDVTIVSGPVDLLPESDEKYEQVNRFYIDENYKEFPKTKKVLNTILKIANNGNYIASEDGDYGSIPSFYTRINIGSWDKPYQVIKK
jgi:hypothetical protein